MTMYLIDLVASVIAFCAALVFARSTAGGIFAGLVAGAIVLLLPEIWTWLLLAEVPRLQLLLPPNGLLAALLCAIGGAGGGHLRSSLEARKNY